MWTRCPSIRRAPFRRPDLARIAIVGGGIAGLTAAWQLTRLGVEFTLHEASGRVGGTVEAVQQQGFTVELGPDGWVSEKPWAAELARDLGLGEHLRPSLDEDRVTYILTSAGLTAMPDGMRMMVPSNLQALESSALFSDTARKAYAAEITRADELRASSPHHDESVASFVERHFGSEVLEKLAAPLLSGVFGGDVNTLSVRSVMPNFVQMEREHGSLILALQAKNRGERAAQRSIFTTLAGGTQSLVDEMERALPAGSLRLHSSVERIEKREQGWELILSDGSLTACEHLVLATPAHVTRSLLAKWPGFSDLLDMKSTSAVIAAFGFDGSFALPKGFGFLVPFTEPSPLLACTFVDQKFDGRVPAGRRLIRGFFGGANAPEIIAMEDSAVASLALQELRTILGPMPEPLFTLVRRWPKSLPQYAIGHHERMVRLGRLVDEMPGLHLLGNAYHGVGLPDLIRDARALARRLA